MLEVKLSTSFKWQPFRPNLVYTVTASGTVKVQGLALCFDLQYKDRSRLERPVDKAFRGKGFLFYWLIHRAVSVLYAHRYDSAI